MSARTRFLSFRSPQASTEILQLAFSFRLEKRGSRPILSLPRKTSQWSTKEASSNWEAGCVDSVTDGFVNSPLE